MMSVLVVKAFSSFSGFYFSKRLKEGIVMFSCQRHAFICLFSRVLKVVYGARGGFQCLHENFYVCV